MSTRKPVIHYLTRDAEHPANACNGRTNDRRNLTTILPDVTCKRCQAKFAALASRPAPSTVEQIPTAIPGLDLRIEHVSDAPAFPLAPKAPETFTGRIIGVDHGSAPDRAVCSLWIGTPDEPTAVELRGVAATIVVGLLQQIAQAHLERDEARGLAKARQDGAEELKRERDEARTTAARVAGELRDLAETIRDDVTGDTENTLYTLAKMLDPEGVERPAKRAPRCRPDRPCGCVACAVARGAPKQT